MPMVLIIIEEILKREIYDYSNEEGDYYDMIVNWREIWP